METFQACGWPAFATLGAGMLAAVVALVALSLAIFSPKTGLAVAALALAFACSPAGAGALGTVHGRSVVDGAVSGASIDPAQRERIREIGYQEAAGCTTIGLVASGPALLFASVALMVAFVRRKPAP